YLSYKILMMPGPAAPLKVREYLAQDGASPFRDWLVTLDIAVRARVQARLLRFETGNLGHHKGVGGGVLEARLDFGPGYRIYFGMEDATVVVLLAGGSKSSQRRDIRRALAYWRDYLEARDHGKAKQGLERRARRGPSRS